MRPLPIQKLYLLAGYVDKINQLKSVLTNIAGAIGGLVIIYGGIKFALAFQKLDQQGEHQAVFTIVAGAVLLGLTAIVSLFGV